MKQVRLACMDYVGPGHQCFNTWIKRFRTHVNQGKKKNQIQFLVGKKKINLKTFGVIVQMLTHEIKLKTT